jgi:hypothetical protein
MALHTSKMSVLTSATRRHLPEDTILTILTIYVDYDQNIRTLQGTIM